MQHISTLMPGASDREKRSSVCCWLQTHWSLSSRTALDPSTRVQLASSARVFSVWRARFSHSPAEALLPQGMGWQGFSAAAARSGGVCSTSYSGVQAQCVCQPARQQQHQQRQRLLLPAAAAAAGTVSAAAADGRGPQHLARMPMQSEQQHSGWTASRHQLQQPWRRQRPVCRGFGDNWRQMFNGDRGADSNPGSSSSSGPRGLLPGPQSQQQQGGQPQQQPPQQPSVWSDWQGARTGARPALCGVRHLAAGHPGACRRCCHCLWVLR